VTMSVCMYFVCDILVTVCKSHYMHVTLCSACSESLNMITAELRSACADKISGNHMSLVRISDDNAF